MPESWTDPSNGSTDPGRPHAMPLELKWEYVPFYRNLRIHQVTGTSGRWNYPPLSDRTAFTRLHPASPIVPGTARTDL